MTAQIPDQFSFGGRLYDYVAQPGATLQDPHYVLGGGPHLFRLEDYDLVDSDPSREGWTFESTACRRGYACIYEIADRRLFLRDLSLQVSPSLLKPFCGVNAVNCAESPTDQFQDSVYLGLKMPMNYTGSIQVGIATDRTFWMNIGWQLPCFFSEVKELVFREGLLVRVHDHTATVQRQRQTGKLPPRDEQVLESLGE